MWILQTGALWKDSTNGGWQVRSLHFRPPSADRFRRPHFRFGIFLKISPSFVQKIVANLSLKAIQKASQKGRKNVTKVSLKVSQKDTKGSHSFTKLSQKFHKSFTKVSQ